MCTYLTILFTSEIVCYTTTIIRYLDPVKQYCKISKIIQIMMKSKGRRCDAGFEISSARESLITALVSSGFHHQEFLIREAASYLFSCATGKYHLIFFWPFGVVFFLLLIDQISDVNLMTIDKCPSSVVASLRPVTAVLITMIIKNHWKNTYYFIAVSHHLVALPYFLYLLRSFENLVAVYTIASNRSTETYYYCGNIRCLPEQSKPDGRSQFKTAVS